MTQTFQPRPQVQVHDERTVVSETPAHVQSRRLRWWWVAALLVVVGYYAVALVNVRGHDPGLVALDGGALASSEVGVTLHIEAVDLDTSAGAFAFTLRPIVEGALQAEDGIGLAEPLRVEVSSSNQPTEVFEFPAGQIVDPVAVMVGASQGANAFPFDRPRTDFALRVVSGGQWVPAAVEINDQTDDWRLAGEARMDDDRLAVDLQGRRDALAISFALLYIIGIVVVGMIAVLVVGGSLLRGAVGFDEIIWLGAMLVAIPSVRNQMPGVPPIGTVADLFVYFPTIVIVGVALTAGVVVMSLSGARDSAAAGRPGSDG
jgi:hypothetical protein